MRIATCTGWSRACLAGGLIILFCGVIACSQKPEPPPVAYMGPTVARASLGVEKAAAVKTGYTLLESQPSVGRFPGAFAVARLMNPEENWRSDNSQKWEVGTIGFEEAITWNTLADRIPAIREMIVLDKNSTVSPTADLIQISSSARRLQAGMCLVYGPAPAQAERAARWGVILDSANAAKIAFVQAEAGSEDWEPPHADRRAEDLRHMDVNYLAQTKFQQQVRLCVLALIERDRPPATTQPSPWQAKTAREQPIYILPPRPTPAW